MLSLRFFRLLTGTALLIFALSACGGFEGGGHGGRGGESSAEFGGGIGGTGDGDGDGGAQGTLQIVMSGRDAPGFDSLRVGVSQVEIHDSAAPSLESGWISLDLEESELDIVRLVDGRMSVLAQVPLASGGYDGIRIRFSGSSASVLGLTQDIGLVGSGEEVLQPDALIMAGEEMSEVVELDFDSVGSIQVVGQDKFKLRPVVSIVNPSVLGTITGSVQPLGIGAEVRAYLEPSGDLVAAASVRPDGSFTLPRLAVYRASGAPAEYRVLATAPGYLTSEPHAPVDLLPNFTADGFAFSLENADESLAAGSGEYFYWWEESGNSGQTGGGKKGQ